MNIRFAAFFIFSALTLNSCVYSLIYHVYPGRPKEKNFKAINPQTQKIDSSCLIKTDGYYLGLDLRLDQDPETGLAFYDSGYKYAIFFPDGRFSMDLYYRDTTGFNSNLGELRKDFRKAQFYGYYSCKGDTVQVEYVSEVRDGMRNNYYFKTFIVEDNLTISSGWEIYRRARGKYKAKHINKTDENLRFVSW